MEYTRTSSEDKIRKRAWERCQNKNGYPQDTREVMETFSVPHPTVSKGDLQETESDLNNINKVTVSGW